MDINLLNKVLFLLTNMASNLNFIYKYIYDFIIKFQFQTHLRTCEFLSLCSAEEWNRKFFLLTQTSFFVQQKNLRFHCSAFDLVIYKLLLLSISRNLALCNKWKKANFWFYGFSRFSGSRIWKSRKVHPRRSSWGHPGPNGTPHGFLGSMAEEKSCHLSQM